MADNFTPTLNIRQLYDRFNASVTEVDCGIQCAPHNPNGKPFCCDICKAVPVAYNQEWDYLRQNTDLWHIWRGDECSQEPCDPSELLENTPQHLQLLACKGPAFCQRQYRASSCRQFPFFPYVTANYRFIGLAYDWDFEPYCWVISHLDQVTETYRREFIRLYDELFALWEEEFDSYSLLSEDMREAFIAKKRRIPLLHRNGKCYLISPGSERMQKIAPNRLKRYGPYQ
ncbi:MAG: hypothetical protein HGA53_10100 [Anaerolineaceae bacterium]|nr:hypothetical protein [Anaerolineaceae bacterium]